MDRPLYLTFLSSQHSQLNFTGGGVEDGSKLSTYFRHVGPFQVSRLDTQRQLPYIQIVFLDSVLLCAKDFFYILLLHLPQLHYFTQSIDFYCKIFICNNFWRFFTFEWEFCNNENLHRFCYCNYMFPVPFVTYFLSNNYTIILLDLQAWIVFLDFIYLLYPKDP